MNVVDLHPEELIDKLAEGALTSVERDRLNAHLAQCASCRFEIGVRADLASDVPVLEARPQLTFGGEAHAERAPRRLTAHERPVPPAPLSVRPRSRRRWPPMLLAASLVLCAGGAAAAVFTGAVSARWPSWPEPKTTELAANTADPKRAPKARRALAKTVPGLASAPVASSDVPQTVPPVAAEVSVSPPPSAAATVPTAVRAHRAEAALPVSGGARSSSPAALATAPGTSNPVEAPVARSDAASLFADANRARRDGNVDRAVGLYRTLQSRYPGSSESELSRALLAQLLLERGSPEAALAGFDRYLADGTAVLSAEALVGRARALEQLGKSAQAAAAWRQVQSRFPGSVHARLAATRLAALGMR